MRWEHTVRQSIMFVLGTVEVFIGLRVFLKLLGANPVAPLAAWIYEVSGTFLYPFEGMFATWSIGGRSALEFSSLFAMFFYAILTYFILEALGVLLGWRQSLLEVLQGKKQTQ